MRNFGRMSCHYACPRFAASLVTILGTLSVSALETREPNTTLVVPQEPPVYGYQTVNAFGSLTFSRPVAIAQQPGETNRLFIVEQAGNIYVITNLAAPTKTLFMNLTSRVRYVNNEEGLLGMAFHPDWRNNGYFYLFFTTDVTTAAGTGRHDRLARFEVDPANPNAGLVASEFPLISQWDRDWNHNGGDVHFGPDGYLYVSTGSSTRTSSAPSCGLMWIASRVRWSRIRIRPSTPTDKAGRITRSRRTIPSSARRVSMGRTLIPPPCVPSSGRWACAIRGA
jgi:glucose/arabinose dehydrogenase